ncbi:SUF system NifU family Fe-S cluster assembly protein [Candidatus Woesearchaeota archaeon]|nr:SUF system NifU family Fe-S cluster assembly protein [Candidatus Woesearchaeota archaeon]
MDAVEMIYQENILDHYKNPRNFGKIDDASVHHHEYNPLCGDEVDLFLIIDKNKKVTDVKFNGHGCAISQASASMLTEQIKGKSIDELRKMTKEDILEMLGIPISPVRLKCALLSLDTLKNSILIFEKYIKKKFNAEH